MTDAVIVSKELQTTNEFRCIAAPRFAQSFAIAAICMCMYITYNLMKLPMPLIKIERCTYDLLMNSSKECWQEDNKHV
jgi:hypothetical protein